MDLTINNNAASVVKVTPPFLCLTTHRNLVSSVVSLDING
jgi:hypothetical protein